MRASRFQWAGNNAIRLRGPRIPTPVRHVALRDHQGRSPGSICLAQSAGLGSWTIYKYAQGQRPDCLSPIPNVYQSVELRDATVVGFDSGSNDRAVGPWRFLGSISQAAGLGYANGWAFGPDHGQPERV